LESINGERYREGIKITQNGIIECDKMVSREDLLKKMTGKPDFIPEEHYCHGTGAYCRDNGTCVQLVAKANLPSRFGDFTLYGFYDGKDNKEHTAIVRGDLVGREDVPLRIHSQCHTGDVLGSLRCDCRDQLEAALTYIGKREFGAVVYLMQEGRGIGLLNKIKAYALQDLGLDTVEANQYLGYPGEGRDYEVGAKIIELLGIKSIALMTNNPDKIEKLRSEGILITNRIPIVIEPNSHDEEYLKTKRERMGHLL
jgi:GTP cyclohydrolase II